MWVSENTRAVRDAHGALLCYEGTTEDITARKQAEEALRESEERYRELVENANDIVYTLDLEGNITSVNPAAERVTGYTREEALTLNITQVMSPDDFVLACQMLQAKKTDGQPTTYALEIYAKDGHKVALELSTRLVYRDGKLVGSQGIARDITERKHTLEALRESEERFSGAFEYAAIGMALVSPDGRWLRVNRSLCELTGYSESELLSKTFQEITHPDDLDTDLSYVRQMLAGELRTYQMEKRYLHKLGHVVWVLLSVSLVRDARGGPLHFIAQIQNISARKQAEESLQRRADEFAALYDTTRDLAQVEDLSTLLQTIVERATHLLNTSDGGMYICDSVRGDLEVKVATEASTPIGTRLQAGEGMAGHVAQTRQPLIVDDYRTWPYRSTKYAGTPLTAVMEVPMLFDRELVGVLVVEEIGETARKFTDQDARLLSLFASHAASVVYNAQLLAEARRRADEFAALHDIIQDLTMQQDLATLLGTIVDRAAALVAAPGGGIYLYDAEQGDLSLVAPKGNALTAGLRLRFGEGLAGRVAQTRQPMLVDDYGQWEHRSPQYAGIPIAAVAQVPMLYGGDLIGVLAVHQIDTTGRKFTDADARLLSLFAGQAASAVYNARLLEETRQRAQRQEALYRVSMSLTHLRSVRELCETVVHACSEFLGYCPSQAFSCWTPFPATAYSKPTGVGMKPQQIGGSTQATD